MGASPNRDCDLCAPRAFVPWNVLGYIKPVFRYIICWICGVRAGVVQEYYDADAKDNKSVLLVASRS